MPKIGDLVSKLHIGDKTFQNPEWWSTRHKLKKDVKIKDMLKVKFDIAEFTVNKQSDTPIDYSIRSLSSKLDMPEYKEFAPWNPLFKKVKHIILFRK